MGIREDRAYLQDRKAERNALNEAAEKKYREDFNQAIIDREDIIAAHESALDKFYKFKDDVKKTLVKKALMELCTGSFRDISARERAICENLVEAYIEDTGIAKLMKNMKLSESSILRTIAEKAEEAYSDITADATADDAESQTISQDAINDFWNNIDKAEDVEDITNLIRMRVSNAEEEFVNKNQEDKEDVKTILKQTATRVANAKSLNDNDYSEAVEESETRLAKSAIYKVQHESYHNVFDRMVRNLSEVAMSNEEAKKMYVNEAGRLDVERIVESVRCMYTLLETVATIQLENVDNDYIEDTLKSIK